MLRRTAIVLCLILAAANAAAASFVVNPIRVNLTPEQRVVALSVTNNGKQPVRVQAQPMAWRVEDNEDAYVASTELLVNPPLFTLDAGATQVLRLGLRNARATDREATYRLFLTEVPGPVGPDFNGLSMALRLGVPIFVQPLQAASPQLDGTLVHNDLGLKLEVNNTGLAHARLLEAVFSAADGRELGRLPLARDILADQQRTLELHPQPDWQAAVRVHVRVDPESAEFDLDLPAPQ